MSFKDTLTVISILFGIAAIIGAGLRYVYVGVNQPPKREHLIRILSAIGAVILIVISIGIGVQYAPAAWSAITYSPSAATQTARIATVHSINTKIANYYATATVEDAQATATTNAESSVAATVGAKATATADVEVTNRENSLKDPYLSSDTRPPVLNDPLKDNSKSYKWDEKKNINAGSCGFLGQAYDVNSSAKLYAQFCNAKNSNYSNFAYQVEMTIINGDCGGLIFRANMFEVYFFEICQNGHYSLRALVDGHDVNTQTLPHAFTRLLNSDRYKPNLIAVVAHNNFLDLYVNLQLIASGQSKMILTGVR